MRLSCSIKRYFYLLYFTYCNTYAAAAAMSDNLFAALMLSISSTDYKYLTSVNSVVIISSENDSYSYTVSLCPPGQSHQQGIVAPIADC